MLWPSLCNSDGVICVQRGRLTRENTGNFEWCSRWKAPIRNRHLFAAAEENLLGSCILGAERKESFQWQTKTKLMAWHGFWLG